MATWINIILAATSVIAAIAAWLGWRESHAERDSDSLRAMIESCLQPLSARVTLVEQRLIDVDSRSRDAIEAAITRALQPIQSQVAVLESKMDVFWKQVAMDAAKILHQPDPRRADIDSLLESFMEDALSPDEELELRKYLLKIRNWEPGQDLGFPVYPGEQTAAAILLRTMNHVITPRHNDAQHYHGDADE